MSSRGRVLLAGVAPEVESWFASDFPGFAIQQADTFDEALRLLIAGGFDLVVVEDELPGGGGEGLLEQIQERGYLADVPVLFCIRSGTDLEMARRVVTRLGVSQLLIEPLERDELRRQVARLLPGAPPAADPGADVAERTERVRAGIAALWEKHQPTILERLAATEDAVVSLLAGELDEETRRRAEREAHKLAGSVGTFGFVSGSRLAREVELLLADSGALGREQLLPLSDAVVELRRELAGPLPVSDAPAVPPVPERTVLVFTLDAGPLEGIEAELRAVDLHGLVINTLPELRQTLSSVVPAAAVVDLGAAGSESARMALRTLGALEPPVPTAVLISGEALRLRVEAASLGARAFLQKPIGTARLVEEIQAMLQRARPRAACILAVDDDPQVLDLLRTTLGATGWTLETLDDPLAFWTRLESDRPDLVILDVDMPHLSGVELCRVVRRDPRWQGLPVLFLTARDDAETVQRVFTAGGDDFVTKPFVGPELVTRIRNRLERAQLFRTLAETDPLTGIPNRRKAGDLLDQLRRLALRHRQPFCLAIIDVDRFKQVNDTHGHPAGDRVLVRLAEQLQAAFRGEDVVGRWGGEEFVLGMYGMTRADGVARLQAILNRFRTESFEGHGGDPFHVTFSGGVAEAPPDGVELADLYRAADAALYQAKGAGRGRVNATGEEGTEGQRYDVVLVEDDETLAALLQHALGTRGYSSAWLRGGHQAAEALTGPAPPVRGRLLLLDVDLPGMDGLSLLRRLVREGVTRTSYAIMLTARSGEPEVVEALKLGAVDHVGKPFSIPVLMERIRRILEF